MTENCHANKHNTRSILMQDISLCDKKTQHYKQKLYDIHNRCSECPPFAVTQVQRCLYHCFTVLSMTHWSTHSHSSVLCCYSSSTVHLLPVDSLLELVSLQMVYILNICCATFAVNAEFCCHMFCIKKILFCACSHDKFRSFRYNFNSKE